MMTRTRRGIADDDGSDGEVPQFKISRLNRRHICPPSLVTSVWRCCGALVPGATLILRGFFPNWCQIGPFRFNRLRRFSQLTQPPRTPPGGLSTSDGILGKRGPLYG